MKNQSLLEFGDGKVRIYTSNFSKIAEVPNPIIVCNKPPESAKHYPWAKKVRPSWNIIQKVTDAKKKFIKNSDEMMCAELDYCDKYSDELKAAYGIQDIRSLVKVMFDEFLSLYDERPEEITLICFCKADEFCHRKYLAQLFDWILPEAEYKGEAFNLSYKFPEYIVGDILSELTDDTIKPNIAADVTEVATA